MKRGFYTIMSAQFFSSLADQALFVVAVDLMRSSGAPEWQRAALVLRFYDDRSEAEAAAVLGCRPGTVGSLVHRGLAQLKKVIDL